METVTVTVIAVLYQNKFLVQKENVSYHFVELSMYR